MTAIAATFPPRAALKGQTHNPPILSRGGGTSLAGQCCNVAVVHNVAAIDGARRLGRVQPGCVLDRFRDTAKERANLWFGPDPATHSRCAVGGMLGNNSCGSHSLMRKNAAMGLRTSDNTHIFEVLLYDGAKLHVGPTAPDELQAIIVARRDTMSLPRLARPPLARVRQHLPDDRFMDVRWIVRDELLNSGLVSSLPQGASIAAPGDRL